MRVVDRSTRRGRFRRDALDGAVGAELRDRGCGEPHRHADGRPGVRHGVPVWRPAAGRFERQLHRRRRSRRASTGRSGQRLAVHLPVGRRTSDRGSVGLVRWWRRGTRRADQGLTVGRFSDGRGRVERTTRCRRDAGIRRTATPRRSSLGDDRRRCREGRGVGLPHGVRLRHGTARNIVGELCRVSRGDESRDSAARRRRAALRVLVGSRRRRGRSARRHRQPRIIAVDQREPEGVDDQFRSIGARLRDRLRRGHQHGHGHGRLTARLYSRESVRQARRIGW